MMEYYWSDFKSHGGIVIPVAFGVGLGLIYRSKPLQRVQWIYERLQFIKRKQANAVVPLKMVIVVRGDLAMSAGKVGSQCAHAACLCYDQAMIKDDPMVREWGFQGSPKIVLHGGPGGEKTLKQIYRSAVQKGIIAGLVRDAGRTQVRQGTLTVVGVGPGPAFEIDKITGNLKIL